MGGLILIELWADSFFFSGKLNSDLFAVILKAIISYKFFEIARPYNWTYRAECLFWGPNFLVCSDRAF